MRFTALGVIVTSTQLNGNPGHLGPAAVLAWPA